MGTERRNLELKARDPDPERSLEICEGLGGEDRGTLLQEDTYFKVSHGRLKLRREEGRTARLIAYERPDRPERRESRYHLVEVTGPDEMERALADALDIVAVVKKLRRLFVFEGVRIHLDRVKGLGCFIEFEGVAAVDENLAGFEILLADLRHSFGIEAADLVAESYCDLVPARTER
jgi:adenylate cyclase, class 2